MADYYAPQGGAFDIGMDDSFDEEAFAMYTRSNELPTTGVFCDAPVTSMATDVLFGKQAAPMSSYTPPLHVTASPLGSLANGQQSTGNDDLDIQAFLGAGSFSPHGGDIHVSVDTPYQSGDISVNAPLPSITVQDESNRVRPVARVKRSKKTYVLSPEGDANYDKGPMVGGLYINPPPNLRVNGKPSEPGPDGVIPHIDQVVYIGYPDNFPTMTLGRGKKNTKDVDANGEPLPTIDQAGSPIIVVDSPPPPAAQPSNNLGAKPASRPRAVSGQSKRNKKSLTVKTAPSRTPSPTPMPSDGPRSPKRVKSMPAMQAPRSPPPPVPALPLEFTMHQLQAPMQSPTHPSPTFYQQQALPFGQIDFSNAGLVMGGHLDAGGDAGFLFEREQPLLSPAELSSATMHGFGSAQSSAMGGSSYGESLQPSASSMGVFDFSSCLPSSAQLTPALEPSSMCSSPASTHGHRSPMHSPVANVFNTFDATYGSPRHTSANYLGSPIHAMSSPQQQHHHHHQSPLAAAVAHFGSPGAWAGAMSPSHVRALEMANAMGGAPSIASMMGAPLATHYQPQPLSFGSPSQQPQQRRQQRQVSRKRGRAPTPDEYEEPSEGDDDDDGDGEFEAEEDDGDDDDEYRPGQAQPEQYPGARSNRSGAVSAGYRQVSFSHHQLSPGGSVIPPMPSQSGPARTLKRVMSAPGRLRPGPKPKRSISEGLQTLGSAGGSAILISQPPTIEELQANLAAIGEDPALAMGPASSMVPVFYSAVQTKEGKRYRCRYDRCGRTFPRKSAIESHIQTHLEDKPYACSDPDCGVAFVRQHDLRRHERIHSGNKDFMCECGKGFARGDALARHKQRGICEGSVVPRRS